MKTIKKNFLLLLVLLATVVTYAGQIIIGTLTTVNNTTLNGSYAQVSTFLVNPGTYSITNTGVTATNALTVNLQWSIDGTNGFTVATWNPPVTNAGTYTWVPSVSATPMYQRLQVVTTNSVMLGIVQN